jgi:hypothetical protein
MPWTVCLSVYWNDSLQNTHGRTCSWIWLEILFLNFIWNYGSPSLPAKFWGTFSSIVYNELDYIFFLNFGNLRSDLLLTSKSDFWSLDHMQYVIVLVFEFGLNLKDAWRFMCLVQILLWIWWKISLLWHELLLWVSPTLIGNHEHIGDPKPMQVQLTSKHENIVVHAQIYLRVLVEK